MANACVLLDIDGTLVDSAYFHAVAWWRACRRAGEYIPMARLHRLVGMGSDTLTKTVFGRVRSDIAEIEGDEYHRFDGELVALPGAADLIKFIASRGVQAVLASSSRPEDIPRLLTVIGAGSAVAAVVSAGDVEKSKPAPDVFSVAMDRAQADPARTVAVGDTRWDVMSAGASGIPTIGLTSGGWAEEELRDAGAVEVYRDPADLLANYDESILAPLHGEPAASSRS